MGTFSVWHWLIVLVVVLVLFGGGGKIPKLMRDMGKGINAFKKGLKEDKDGGEAEDQERKPIEEQSSKVAGSAKAEKSKEAAEG
jgi:sec-independent protein translocase protein TatA